MSAVLKRDYSYKYFFSRAMFYIFIKVIISIDIIKSVAIFTWFDAYMNKDIQLLQKQYLSIFFFL